MNFEATGTKKKMQLLELDEWRQKAYHNNKIYKERSKDGMTKGSRRSSLQEIRYYSLILGLNYSNTENFGAIGKDHSRL